MQQISQDTYQFLTALQQNNNREWFEKNRKSYLKAKEDFEAFVNLLIKNIGQYENLTDLAAKKCVFRINRDIRFSRDKTPYKKNMSAVIVQGGKKSPYHPFYLHIQPGGGSFVAGGAWEPTAEQLAKLRQEIDYNAGGFKKIFDHPDFKQSFGRISGDSLKTSPKGYSSDHPEIELLRLKQFIVQHRVTDEQLLQEDFARYATEKFLHMQPLLHFLNSILLDEAQDG